MTLTKPTEEALVAELSDESITNGIIEAEGALTDLGELEDGDPLGDDRKMAEVRLRRLQVIQQIRRTRRSGNWRGVDPATIEAVLVGLDQSY